MSILTLNGGEQIYYELLEGDPTRPYLIFLHEGLGCTAMWKDFPRALCRETGCPGLVYDREGYGKSSALTTGRTIHYLHRYALNELPRVIDAVISGKPYILIGHSDGGSISLIHGAEKPPLLKGIITEAAHVFVEQETLDGIRQADLAFEQGRLDGLSKYHGEKTRDLFKAWSVTWTTPGFRHWNIEYLLPSIACPLLVIQGEDDQYGTVEQVRSIVSGSSGAAKQVLIEHCGHSPHQQMPDKVLQLMSAFVKRHN